MSRIIEQNFYPSDETSQKIGKEREQDRETKKKIRNFVMAFMAFVSFGGGVEVGRKLEQAEPKEKEKVEKLDDRKLPEIIIDKNVYRPEKKLVESVTPEEGEGVETEFASSNGVSFRELYNLNHRGRFNNADIAEKQLENHWLEYYLKNKNKLAGKQKAYKELSQWLPAIDKRLAESGIRDDHVRQILPFVSIVENEKISDKKANKKGAVGPFGFTGKTAKIRKINLSIGGGVDERLDPVAAGVASHTLLKDNLDKIGDIDLAIAAYNGRAWGYVNKAKANNEHINYHNYIHYSENILNFNKELIESNRWEIYRAKKGETLTSIVKKYIKNGRQTNVEKIFQANNSIGRDRKLAEGEKIFLPLNFTASHTKEEQKEAFNLLSAGIEQNLNYVAKINAIKILRERGIIHETKPPVKFKEVKHSKGKKAMKFKDIAVEERVPVELVEAMNRKFINNKIPPGAMYRRPAGGRG